jgi:glycosyltransferase involved in cell wall biosynthesis
VRWIVVHDHTSGVRTAPRGVRRLLKRARQWIPGSTADRVIAVSDFVADRKVSVDLVPAARVRRVWNSRHPVERDPDARPRLLREFDIPPGPVVACACRATPEKGVAQLLRAFGSVWQESPENARPTLVYFGDGPQLEDLHAITRSLDCDSIILAGYRPDAADLLAGADICVVPSVWHEAFGLAVLEPMSYGIPVIASRVGGIPELVEDGTTGLLVEPGNELALARALKQLLDHPAEREQMGRQARERARTHFLRSDALLALIDELDPGLTRAR